MRTQRNVTKGAEHNHKGVVLLKQRHFEKALGEFGEAIALDPKPLYFSNAGFALFELKRYQESISAYDEALKLDSNNPNSHAGKANALARLKRFDAAINEYSEAARLKPDIRFFQPMAGFHSLQGRHEQALNCYDWAIRLMPPGSGSILYYYRGQELDALRRYGQAAASYGEAVASYSNYINRNPLQAGMYANRSDAFVALKQYQSALEDCEQAIRLDPMQAIYHSKKGVVLASLKRFEEAALAHQEALRLNPNAATCHGNLADLMMLRNRFDEAVKECDRALELNPSEFIFNEAVWRNRKGLALMAQEKYTGAISEYSRALELQLYNPLYRADRAKAFARLGKASEALNDLKYAINLDPSDPKLWVTHAEILALNGDADKAANVLAEAVKTGRMDLPTLCGAVETEMAEAKRLSDRESNVLKRFVQENCSGQPRKAPAASSNGSGEQSGGSGFPGVTSTRRLAAIMFTDMVGFTASAQADEAEALRLRDEQAGLVRPLFAAHQGREIKSMGDGFLAEFDSALRAVQCAIDIQQHLHLRNSQPGVAAIQLRIGVHLGDVEQRETDIFGDAVNIASRIEPLASPGGLCISGEVFSQVRNKIPNRLEKLPPTTLKGVEVPTDIYRVVLPWTVREIPSAANGPTRLAVLPFTNMSPDPADLYFADGLTEELITVLSQIRELLVIARTSVMQYKSTTKEVSQIGTELGVSSLLEGSVRRAGNRLRITAQLIDVGSQGHVWANSYDRELDDVFVIQTEIAKQVAEALKIELRPPEEARLEARPTVRPDSYLAYLKGRTLMHSFSRPTIESAKAQFELAISLDPNNAAAHSGLADALRLMVWWFPGVHRKSLDESGRLSAARAVELDPNLAEGHASLAEVLWDDLDYPGAEKELKLALSLNPSYSSAHSTYAYILQDEGRADEALREFKLAEAADPLDLKTQAHLTELLIWLGRLEEAYLKIRRVGELEPTSEAQHMLLAEYHLARFDRESALKEIRLVEDLRTTPIDKQLARGWYYAVSGEREKLDALVRDETILEHPLARYHIGLYYAELGDLDACFQWLERKLETTGEMPLQRIRLDPRLGNLRKDPRFQVLLKKMNLA